MPLPDPASRARLAAMDIAVWVRRSPAVSSEAIAGTRSAQARVRLASGDGEWLLVQRRPWDGRHPQLVADLQALLGPARCRFGQWADSAEAGHALAELGARGIRYLLSFGPPPAHDNEPEVVVAAALDELAASAEARRNLWAALCPRLAG